MMSKLTMPLIGCMTLGLAPFRPEPHVLGKLRWALGGAEGMGLMDWGDFLMHGAPFLWLGYAVIMLMRSKLH